MIESVDGDCFDDPGGDSLIRKEKWWSMSRGSPCLDRRIIDRAATIDTNEPRF